MKFILEEPKHILNEKFILTEAPTASDFKNTREDAAKKEIEKVALKLKDIINIIKKDETIHNYKLNETTLAELNELAKSIDLLNLDSASDVDYKAKLYVLIDLVDKYLDTLIKQVGKILPTKVFKIDIDELTKNIKTLTDKVEQNNINGLSTLVDRGIKQKIEALTKTINNDKTGGLKPKNEAQDKLKNILGDIANILNELYQKPVLITTTNDEALATRKILQNFYNNIPVASNFTEKSYSKLIDACTEFKTSFINTNYQEYKLGQLAKQQEKNKENSDLAALASQQSDTGINWAKRFKETEGITERKALWYNYYKQVWKDNAEKVKALGYAFQDELKQYGFEEYSNPFITFVKIIIKKGLNIDATHYDAIDTAFNNNYINKDDLNGTGELGLINIIFSQDLYNYNSDDMLVYLKKQKLARTYYSKGFNNTILTNKYGSAQDNKIQIFMLDLMYTPGNTIVADEKRVEGNLKMKLKALRTIDHELTVCFPESAAVSNSAKSEQVDFEKIVRNLSTKTDYINFMKFLIATYGADSIEQQELLAKYRDLSGKEMPSMQTMIAFRKIIGDNVKLKGTELNKLIKKLAEKGDIK